jgi:hypothetical protein
MDAGGVPGHPSGSVPSSAHRSSASGNPPPSRRCASAKPAKKYNVLRTPMATSPRQAADAVPAAHIIQELQSVIEVMPSAAQSRVIARVCNPLAASWQRAGSPRDELVVGLARQSAPDRGFICSESAHPLRTSSAWLTAPDAGCLGRGSTRWRCIWTEPLDSRRCR